MKTAARHLILFLAFVASAASAATFNETVTFNGSSIFKSNFSLLSSTDSTAGAITALSTSGKNLISLTGASPILQGISDTSAAKVVRVLNNSGGTLSVANESVSATAALRIVTGTGTSVSIADKGSISFIYDSANSRWKILSTGAPTVTVPSTNGPVYATGSGASFSSVAWGGANTVFGVVAAGSAGEFKALSTGTSGTDFAIANGAGTITFNLPDASASARGLITTGGQNIAGGKTFTQAVNITAATNQLVLGSSTTTTLSAVAPASSRVVSIQDPGANADVVTTAGAQTLAGVKTFSSQIPITAVTNQLVLGTTNTTTISAVAPSASRTVSLQDPGGNADFVTTAGNQTIGGVKNSTIADSSQIISANGTTALTATSPVMNLTTGSAAQTITLPSTAGLTVGYRYKFSSTNSSAVGAVTIQTSTGVVLTSLSNGFGVTFECVSTTVNTAAAWFQIGNNTEIIELDGSAGVSVGTSNVNHDIATLTLPPGSFEVSIVSMVQANGATTWTRSYTSICTATGDNFTGASPSKEYVVSQGTFGTSDSIPSSLNFKKTQTSSTNYYFKFQSVFGALGPPTGYYYVKAKRIY